MPKNLRTNKRTRHEAVTASNGAPTRRLLSIQATPDVGAIRTATLMEQEYTIVPCVALVEGVLWPANAEKPELALAEEFGKFPDGWNGRPVVLNHPRIDDTPVSANEPSVLEEYAIGQLFNTALDGAKLKTEIWINNARVAELGGEFEATVERLKAGEEVVEVSTGLFTVNEIATGEFDGEEYSAIWRNIVPDHLALLTEGSVGACSVADGCGAPRNNEGKTELEPAMRANVLRANCTCQDAVTLNNDDPEGGEQEGLFKRLMAAAGNILTFRDQSESVSDGDIRTAIYAALTAEDPQSYCFIIAVFHGSDDSGRFVYEEGYFGTLYQRTFSLNDDGSISLGNDREPVRPVTQFVPVTINADAAGDEGEGEEGPTGNAYKRKRKRKQKQERTMTKKELVQSLIDNESTKFTKDDAKWLEGLEESNLQKLFPPEASNGEEEEEEETTPANAAAATPANNTGGAGGSGAGGAEATPQSEDDYIKQAPPGIREVLSEGLRMQRSHKDTLIKGLVENERCRFSKEDLEKRSLSELQNLAELARVEVSYEGAASVGTDSLRANEDDEIPAPPLVFEPKDTQAA